MTRNLTLQLLSCLDGLADFSGRVLAWLLLLMMVATCGVVLLRYVFSINFVAMQESITYMHALVFMLGVAYTLKCDGHVRVDIFYRRFTETGKAWINAVGGLVFLLPICVFTLISSWDYTLNAWRILEGSPHANGIPAIYLLKSLIPLMAVLLALQGLAEVLRSLLALQDHQ